MRLLLLLLVVYIQFTDALNCIDGYTPVNNKCLRLTGLLNFRDNAQRQCNMLGGNLVSIHNSIDNTAIAQFAFNNSRSIWIGLKCYVDSSPSFCFWDDQLGNSSSYNNFFASDPNLVIGQCVYMFTTGSLRGRWQSGDCNTMTTNAVCETDPIGKCSHFYNGYCYYPLGELTASEAQLACALNCNGNLVSIHSSSENDYVASLFQNQTYFRIGLKSNHSNVNSWNDGSSWNYSNIGYQKYWIMLHYVTDKRNSDFWQMDKLRLFFQITLHL